MLTQICNGTEDLSDLNLFVNDWKRINEISSHEKGRVRYPNSKVTLQPKKVRKKGRERS